MFSDDPTFLKNARFDVEEYLETLRLKIHPIKSQLFKTKYGANFVGFRVLPHQIRVRNSRLRLGKKRIRKILRTDEQGKLENERIRQSLQSWFAHLKHGDTWKLRKNICCTMVVLHKGIF